MSARVSSAALDILAAAVVEGQGVRLPSVPLDRVLYEEVNEVLVRLGGKWKRHGKARDGVPQGTHEFPYDPAPLLSAVMETGEMPPKNPTAFFPTPPAIVAKMVTWARLAEKDSEHCRVLEPSAGTGAILDAIRETAPSAQLDAVEVLPINAAMLRRKGYAPHEMDFLHWRPEYQYDAVLMNPPFSLDGDPLAYITHIDHAWSLLRDGGDLVAITPPGWQFRSDAKSREFQMMVGEYGESDEIPTGAFKESGTAVATRIVWMRKDNQTWKANEYAGWPSWHCWAANLWSDNEREFTESRDRIFDRLRAGALTVDLFGAPEGAARAEIAEHFRKIIHHANAHHEGIRPTDADMGHLVAHFVEEYRLWLEWESESTTTESEAA